MILRPAVLLVPLALSAQTVVSVHSGVVHYFEGSVTIGGQPVEQRFGRFQEIPEGSELRTDRGRAEVLLTPGILLRVDENSSIRMVSNKLTDTKVAFIGGSVAVDSRNGAAGAPVALTFQNYVVHFRAPGSYRLDSAPARLRIDSGEAEVSFMGKTVTSTANHAIAFAPSLTAGPFVNNLDDGLDRWSLDRSRSVAADNATAATSDSLTANLDSGQGLGYGGGGGGYGGVYGGGGGYTLGVDPVFLSPADVWATNSGLLPWAPLSMYPTPLVSYLFVSPYRRMGGGIGFRPYEPVRRGAYIPPTMVHRPLVHAAPTFVRQAGSVRGIGGGVHAARHR